MKKIILFICFTAFVSSVSFAQEFKYGLKIGISPGANSGTGIAIKTGTETFDLNMKRSKQDYSAGIWGTVKLQKFYIAPEVMFNTFGIEYRLVGPNIKGLDTVKTDRFYRLDVPIMLGYRIGKVVFLKAGPSIHVNLGGKSDLSSFAGFTAKYPTIQYGYQLGVAFALGKKTQLDFRLNRFFDDYGKHIYFDNKQSVFPHKFRRLFIGLAFTL